MYKREQFFDLNLTLDLGAVFESQDFKALEPVNQAAIAPKLDLATSGPFFMNSDQPDTAVATGALSLNGAFYQETISTETDIDFYDFAAVAGEALEIIFQYQYIGQIAYQVLDSQGNVLIDATGSGTNFTYEVIDFTAATSGTYYFAIQGNLHFDNTGDYAVALLQDTYGDTNATAGSVNVSGGRVEGYTNSETDEDWFEFTVGADTRVFFNRDGDNYNINLRVVDANGIEIIGDGEFDGTDTLTVSLTDAGTYYLIASGAPVYTQYAITADSAGIDIAGDNSTTATITMDGTPQESFIDVSGDQDWFEFNVAANETVAFSIEASDNVILEIYNANGESIAIGFTDYLLAELSEAGTYYVAVAYNGNGIGQYTLSGDIVTDDFGQTSTDAGMITVDGNAVEGGLNFVGDVDWLEVSLTAGQVVRFDSIVTDNPSGEFHTLTLIDETGFEVEFGSTRGSTGRAYVIYDVDFSGTYYIRLEGQSSDAVLDYSITARTLEDVISDTVAGALSVPTTGVAATGTIEFTGDVDVFSFSYDGTGAIVFDLTTEGQNFEDLEGFVDVFGRVLDSNGNEISANLDLFTGDAGTYFIEVSADDQFGLLDSTNYALSVTAVSDDYAGDATTTGSLSLNGIITEGSMDYVGDTDWFAIDVTAGEEIYLNLAAIGRSFENPQIEIFDAAGNSIGTNFVSNLYSSDWLFEAAETGRYYVSVQSEQLNDSDSIGQYQISADSIGATDEQGDTNATAGTLEIGQRIAARIDFNSVGNEDYDHFTFTAEAGQTLSFSMFALTLGFPAYGIADEAGNVLFVDEDGGTSTLTFNVGGTYVFIAGSSVFDDLGLYSVLIEDPNAVIEFLFTDNNDTVDGSNVDDTLSALGGNDTVNGLNGDDIIDGGAGNDSLTGGSGDDILIGGLGNDILIGGLGTDTASYADAGSRVTVSLEFGTEQDTLGAGLDTLSQIENLIGSRFNDILIGNGADNILEGGGGSDVLDGGLGIDTASYAGSTNRVIINMAANTITSGHATGDTFISIENITGSRFADTITGNGGNNVITGGEGFDVLSGFTGNDTILGGAGNDFMTGGAGADFIDGGEGISDVVRYVGSNAGVTINLATGTAFGGHADGDTILNTEFVFGSSFDDTIIGDDVNNWLYGDGGNDTLSGGAGIDKFFGGAGSDTFMFAAGDEFVFVTDFQNDIDTIDLSSYGYSDIADALANMNQFGAHVRFFADGDTMLILNTTLDNVMDDISI